MRLLFIASSFFYFGAAVDDTQLVRPSQAPTLQQVLDSGVPEWIGAAKRVNVGD